MKKFTLFAAFAAAALVANAQYTAETPYLEPIATDANNTHFDVIYLDAPTLERLSALPGKTVQEIGPDEETRFLYVWDNTVTFGDASATIPGVGWSETIPNFEGGMNMVVGNIGWSGIGYFIGEASKCNFSHFNENTRFHMAFKTIGTAPASVGLTILSGKDAAGTDNAGKFAVGDPFVDASGTFPSVAPKITDEWVAVDIAFGDLKKLWPAFTWDNAKMTNYNDNILSVLGGGVAGQNVCWDAVYFYTPGQGGDAVNSIEADGAEIVYTGKTINASGANGIALYDLTGKTVKSSASSVIGVEGLAAGIYVVKAGNKTQKIVVR